MRRYAASCLGAPAPGGVATAVMPVCWCVVRCRVTRLLAETVYRVEHWGKLPDKGVARALPGERVPLAGGLPLAFGLVPLCLAARPVSS